MSMNNVLLCSFLILHLKLIYLQFGISDKKIKLVLARRRETSGILHLEWNEIIFSNFKKGDFLLYKWKISLTTTTSARECNKLFRHAIKRKGETILRRNAFSLWFQWKMLTKKNHFFVYLLKMKWKRNLLSLLKLCTIRLPIFLTLLRAANSWAMRY